MDAEMRTLDKLQADKAPTSNIFRQAGADSHTELQEITIWVRDLTSHSSHTSLGPCVSETASTDAAFLVLTTPIDFHFGAPLTSSNPPVSVPVRKAEGANIIRSNDRRRKSQVKHKRRAISHVPSPLQDPSKISIDFRPPPTLSSLPAELTSLIVSHLDPRLAVCLALTSHRHYDRVLTTGRVDKLLEVCPKSITAEIPRMLQAYNVFKHRPTKPGPRGEPDFIWELHNKLDLYLTRGMFFVLALRRYSAWHNYLILGDNYPEDDLLCISSVWHGLQSWWNSHFKLNRGGKDVIPDEVWNLMSRYWEDPLLPSLEWEPLRQRLSRSAILERYRYCYHDRKWFPHGRPCFEVTRGLICPWSWYLARLTL